MRRGAIIALISLLCFGILYASTFFFGEGGLKRMTTISGIYAVEPNGYDVVCFVERSSGSIDCLPK